MKTTDFTHLGGMPGTQQRFDFMQTGYNEAFAAIARMCGDKTILHGVEVNGSNVSAGWISVNGELIRFIGNAVNPLTDWVVFSTAVTPLTFLDNTIHNVHFDKTATAAINGDVNNGDFLFSELVPLETIINNKQRLDAAVNKLLLITHYVSYFETGFVVGDISNDKILNINIPDQQTSNYVVGGSLRGLNVDPNQDNDQMWIVSDKTPTSFKLAIREVPGAGVQNLVFDYTITKAI